MIDLENIDHIYLYPGYTDLRKGRNTLGHMSMELAKNDKEHILFIFCNRRSKMIKIYEKDQTGVWVYIRTLDDSKFGWPSNMKEALEINRSQIEWLLHGLKFISYKKKEENIDYY